jgi:hypothetical protein
MDIKLKVAAVAAVKADQIEKNRAMDFLEPSLSDIQPPGKLKRA